jgi:formamidopyrimidine-DNA glycosylase
VPEYPDVELYLHALRSRVVGQVLTGVRLTRPFLLRTIEPSMDACVGRHVRALDRLGKRIVIELDDELFLVVHLMIAGRFRWRDVSARVPGKAGLAAFDFPNGTLILTEAGSQRRASLHVIRGREALAAHDPGGADVFALDLEGFARQLRRENHTLKRALTDPRLFSGIGNAYSDEILLAARLSPLQLTSRLGADEVPRLFEASRAVLRDWKARLIAETGDAFPEKVTAFREGMGAHGRYGQPCPVCGTPIQRIKYASHESNYCPTCQTGGRLLADRGLSRLLKGDWPRTLEELEAHRGLRQPSVSSTTSAVIEPGSGAAAGSISRSKVRRSAR